MVGSLLRLYKKIGTDAKVWHLYRLIKCIETFSAASPSRWLFYGFVDQIFFVFYQNTRPSLSVGVGSYGTPPFNRRFRLASKAGFRILLAELYSGVEICIKSSSICMIVTLHNTKSKKNCFNLTNRSHSTRQRRSPPIVSMNVNRPKAPSDKF